MAAAVAFAAQPTFLILNSYHHGFEWSDAIMRGMESRLRAEFDRPVIRVEYMDTKRRFDGLGGNYLGLLEGLYADKYSGIRIDALLCSDDVAYRFLLARGGPLFPGAPIVFCGVNDFDPAAIAGRRDVTGIVERSPYGLTIDFGLVLRPGARRLGVVTDASVNGLFNRRTFERLAAAYAGRLEFVFLDPAPGRGLDSLLERIVDFDPDGLIYFVDFYVDASGVTYDYDLSVPVIVSSAPCPVLYHSDMYLGFGVLGGVMNRASDFGDLAAGMAAKIVRGGSPGDIPVVDRVLGVPVLSYPAALRFGIPPSRAPKGTILWNRPATFLERYWRVLAVSGAVVLVLTGIIVALLLVMRSRSEVEQRLRASREELVETLGRAEASEARFRATVAALPVPIFVSSPEGVELVNLAFARSYGYGLDEFPTGEAWWLTIFPDEELRTRARAEWARMRERLDQAPATASGPLEIGIACADGRRRTVDFYAVGIGDRRIFAVIDVTDRNDQARRTERSLREKEALLKEVHHRVKNNLQIVTSLLRLQASSSSPEVAAGLSDSIARLGAMALVHEQVYLSPSLADIEFAEYALGLAESIRSTFDLGSEAFEMAVDAPGRSLGLDRAVPLGLLLGELMTNSFKHGRDAEGRVRIAIRVAVREGVEELMYSDAGPGLPAGLARGRPKGLGLTLVAALAEQLGATFSIDAGPGFRLALRLPAEDA